MRDKDFERLYETHAEPLFSFLVYRTGNRALAEEIMADTFERVLRSGQKFNPRKASEKTWIYTIALNRLRDHVRREAAKERALERAQERHLASNPGPSPTQVEVRDDLYRALEGLSAEEREAIALRYGADLSVPEVAELTSDSVTTAEGRIYRALRKLRDALD